MKAKILLLLVALVAAVATWSGLYNPSTVIDVGKPSVTEEVQPSSALDKEDGVPLMKDGYLDKDVGWLEKPSALDKDVGWLEKEGWLDKTGSVGVDVL